MTTPYDFDRPIERRGTESYKWTEYGDDMLPLWVADMDFAAPEPVLEALHRRVNHGVFGYDRPPAALSVTARHRPIFRLTGASARL